MRQAQKVKWAELINTQYIDEILVVSKHTGDHFPGYYSVVHHPTLVPKQTLDLPGQELSGSGNWTGYVCDGQLLRFQYLKSQLERLKSQMAARKF